jgi:uncharacterized phiE125 gp8 family phage protein
MHVTVVTAPDPIVSWEEAQLHLHLDGDDEQTLVEGLVAAATEWIDGPTGWLGRSLGVQDLEVRFAALACSRLILPYGPVTNVTSIKYLDNSGIEQGYSDSNYTVLSDGSISLNAGASWPATYTDPEAIRIAYSAGYAEVPKAIRAAILLMVGFLFENREASPEQALTSGAVEALLSPYRVWAV